MASITICFDYPTVLQSELLKNPEPSGINPTVLIDTDEAFSLLRRILTLYASQKIRDASISDLNAI